MPNIIVWFLVNNFYENLELKIKNYKGYIILLLSFFGLMILKELEVWVIKKTINQSHPEILRVEKE